MVNAEAQTMFKQLERLPTGRQATTSLIGQDIQDTVSAWKWFENPEPVTLVGASITPRASGFIAGVEFQSTYRPNWSYYAPQAFANTQALGANIVVLTPSWTYTNISPLRFTPIPGQDPLWIDSAIMISQARALGLNIALFPTPNFPASSDASASLSTNFWLAAPRDAQWWQTWFTRYRAFAVNYADLATQTGAQTLILGGDWITPALPGGKLPDGNSIQRARGCRSAMEIDHRGCANAFQRSGVMGTAIHKIQP